MEELIKDKSEIRSKPNQPRNEWENVTEIYKENKELYLKLLQQLEEEKQRLAKENIRLRNIISTNQFNLS